MKQHFLFTIKNTRRVIKTFLQPTAVILSCDCESVRLKYFMIIET